MPQKQKVLTLGDEIKRSPISKYCEHVSTGHLAPMQLLGGDILRNGCYPPPPSSPPCPTRDEPGIYGGGAAGRCQLRIITI